MTSSNDKHRPPTTKLVDLILDNVADGIFTVDGQFRITYFNTAAEQITGYSATEVLGSYCHEVFRTSLCSQDCPLRQSISSGRRVKNIKIDIQSREGKRRTISVSTAPLLDKTGEFLGGVETFRDETELHALRQEIVGKYTFQDIISKNAAMQQIFEMLPNIAQSDATVLIQGASGTGKELFAHAIHNLSPRADNPLVTINCGALPENLLESELFGHVKGAFTDARTDRIGRFQAADGGTILLDEVGEAPSTLQVKLLRVLEGKKIRPVGGDLVKKIDVRVVAATNKDLKHLVAEDHFRSDLYYRLNVILIQLPNLAQRSEDIPLLADHFLERMNGRMGRDIEGITGEAMAILLRHPFPGNVRELQNVLEHAYIVSTGPRIRPEDLPLHLATGDDTVQHHADRLSIVARSSSVTQERQQLIDCLTENGWNVPRTARQLGVHRTTVWRQMKKLRIEQE